MAARPKKAKKSAHIPQHLENAVFAALPALPENLRDASGYSGHGQLCPRLQVTRSTTRHLRGKGTAYEDQQDQQTDQSDVCEVESSPLRGERIIFLHNHASDQ